MFEKTKKASNTLPDTGIKLETPCGQSQVRPLDQRFGDDNSFFIYLAFFNMSTLKPRLKKIINFLYVTKTIYLN